MAYTDQDKVEKYLDITFSDAVVANLTYWIASVKAWIDTYCGKTFEASSAIKYYDGNGLDRLIVDSFVGNPTVVLLETDGTTAYSLSEGQSADYITYPLNSTEKNELVLVPSAQVGSWSKGKRRVKITADFGYSSSVPDDVSMAATMLVARLAEKSIKGGNLESVRIGDYSAKFEIIDQEAMAMGIYNILNKYREIQI